MSYTPINIYVFLAAFDGAQSGILGRSSLTSADPAAYVTIDGVCGAFAEAVDTVWASATVPSLYQRDAIEELCKTYWIGNTVPKSPDNAFATTFMEAAEIITSIVLSGVNWLTGQGITSPPFLPAATGGASIGLSSARPSATGSGKVYYCTDIPVNYVDTGIGTWAQFVLSQYTPTPPAVGAYTLAGNIALYNYADVIRAVATRGVDDTACALIAGSLPQGSPWIVNLVATVNALIGQTYPGISCIVTNGTTVGTSVGYGALMFVGNGFFGSAMTSFTVGGQRLSAPAANVNIAQNLMGGTALIHSRILNDGNLLHFQFSSDGFHWNDIYSQASVAGLNHFGFYVAEDYGGGASGYDQALIFRNDLTALTEPQAAIATMTGNAVQPIVCGVASHSFVNGDLISISGSTGNTNANVTVGGPTSTPYGWIVSDATPTSFTLRGPIGTDPTGNGAYTGGAVATLIGR
jgi:hypothetical protein